MKPLVLTMMFSPHPGLPPTLDYWLPLLPMHVSSVLQHAGKGGGQPEGLKELLRQAGISWVQELGQSWSWVFPQTGRCSAFASSRFQGMGPRTGCKGTDSFQESIGQGLDQEAGLDQGCLDAAGCRGEEGGGGGEEEAEERVWNQL